VDLGLRGQFLGVAPIVQDAPFFYKSFIDLHVLRFLFSDEIYKGIHHPFQDRRCEHDGERNGSAPDMRWSVGVPGSHGFTISKVIIAESSM
jgi:hypothetical protein